jgi:hypothetical protein
MYGGMTITEIGVFWRSGSFFDHAPPACLPANDDYGSLRNIPISLLPEQHEKEFVIILVSIAGSLRQPWAASPYPSSGISKQFLSLHLPSGLNTPRSGGLSTASGGTDWYHGSSLKCISWANAKCKLSPAGNSLQSSGNLWKSTEVSYY